MLSSRFLVASFLCVFWATGLVVADPLPQFGGGRFCQSVRTVTVTRTVTPGRPSPSSQSAKNPKASPVVSTPPGNVNLGNGTTSSSIVKNTKSSSIKINVSSSTSVVKNTQSPSVKTSTSSVKNTNTKTKNLSTSTSSVNVSPTSTPVKGTKTSSILTSSTGLPITSLPPLSTTGRSLVVSSSSTAEPPANTDTGNPSTSLTLDPSVIQNVDGKGQALGEADSIVSPNNFIGFCFGKTLSNGKQVQTGSCNPVPMGDIPSVDNMPSAKFNFPKNFDTIAANTPFTISLQVRNLVTGTFTNAANTYYAAPQQLVNGVIQGHSHVTVQKLTSLDASEPLNPRIFDFFKGLNAAANGGILTADVTKGLPAGFYRIFSINSAGNHQEALGPVAQRGSFNDAVYITVTEDGNGADGISSSSVIDPTPSVLPVSSSVVLPPGAPSDVLSSTISPLAVSPTSPIPSPTGGNGKGGKDPVVSPVSTRQNPKRMHKLSFRA